jgi:hypothetical protein
MARRRFDRTALLRLLAQGLTQAQCAERLGVSKPAICQAIHRPNRPLCIFLTRLDADAARPCRARRVAGSVYCARHKLLIDADAVAHGASNTPIPHAG